MSQINRYSVHEIGGSPVSELNEKDQALITSYTLENIPFILGKYQLDALFYTLDGIYLETKSDIQSYSVLGTNQRDSAVEISVNPVQDALDAGYLGDVQVGYRVTNNLFSPSHLLDPNSTLYLQEISVDRTEIRAASLGISEEDLQSFAQELRQKFTTGPYFTGATLSFLDETVSSWCVNVMTEILDEHLVVTFKLYEPLPPNIGLKSRFTVLDQIGELKKFEVIRTVEVLEDEDSSFNLKGPNFDIDTKTSSTGIVTDYLNYNQLFSYPSRNNYLKLYSIYKEGGIELGIDHSNFSNFIHFSSAAERLENFRYKLGLIQEYEQELEGTDQESEKIRLKKLIQGIIDNFDHYDRYLYFENTETAWPKINVDRPYINADLEEAESWFEGMLQEAQEYDEHNPDKLIGTIPQAIRSNPQNEPYVIFVDMVGHQFDEEWMYAKAVSTRFDGDNRLDFGISKDLVQDALRSFGIELQTTNQNLERIFDLCIPGEFYNKGTELSVKYFERATANNAISGGTILPVSGTIYDGEYALWGGQIAGTTIDGEYANRYGGSEVDIDAGNSGRVPDITEYQPMFVENYRKEIYKRIYHNVPLLLKTKGTTRGIRALINCFGIPESILDIEVQGGAPTNTKTFGPEYFTSRSIDRVRENNTGTEAPLFFSQEAGQFVSGTVLSRYKNTQQPGTGYQKGTNNVSIGFNLNKQINSQIKDYLLNSSNFSYDNIIGDPRNTGENYGEAFSLLRNQILPDLWDSQGKLQIRTPYAILRLVRYIDSVLFRTLKLFAAARDEISVGAIIEDNILHRNRYKGVRSTMDLGTEFDGKWEKSGSEGPRWTNNLTASIETVFIDGGNGGSIQVLRGGRPANKPILSQSFEIRATSARTVFESRELPTVDYVLENGISVGPGYVSKTVFDDSPKYNGELLGTVTEITNGELNEDNKFKAGGSSIDQLDYQVDFRFLCLPAVPLDTVLRAFGEFIGNCFTLEGEGSVTVDSFILSTPETIITSLDKQTVFKLNCARERQQGWLFSPNGVPNLNNNYIGLDMNPNSDAGQVLETEIGRAIGQQAILLPGNSNNSIMQGTFGEVGEDSTEIFWNVVVGRNGFRYIYARHLNPEEGLGESLRLSPIGMEGWPILEEGSEQELQSVSSCYRLTTVEGESRNLEDLIFFYGTHKLNQIYLLDPQEGRWQVLVLDIELGNVRSWEDSLDKARWAVLRGYEEDWDAREYILTKYANSEQTRVVGIILGDEETGTGYGGKKLVLMEPYMNIPQVFVKNPSETLLFRMLVEGWGPESSGFGLT